MFVKNASLIEIHHRLVDLNPGILKGLYQIDSVFIPRFQVSACIRIRRISCQSEQCNALSGKGQYIVVILHNDSSLFTFPHRDIFRCRFHVLKCSIIADKTCRLLIRICDITLGSQKVVNSCTVSVRNVCAHDGQRHH